MDFSELVARYFLTPENAAEVEKEIQCAVTKLLEFFKESLQDNCCSSITLPELERLFMDIDLPQMPQDVASVFNEYYKNVLEHSIRLHNPRFIGHMQSAVPWFMWVCDFFISVLNQNVVKIESALSASFVEKQTLAWLHRLVYNRSPLFYRNNMHRIDACLGNTTNGGHMGNLTALAVARNQMFPLAANEGMAAALLDKGLRRAVILASKRVHYSIKKAAQVLGIGAANVLEIPVIPYSNKINIEALERTLAMLKSQHAAVLAIVGVAGSTETGSVDNLSLLAHFAQKIGAWFHVDAAWAAPFLFSTKLRSLLAGIELADSVTLDGHKLFYLPLNHGAIVFKNEYALDAIRHSAQYIIRPGSVDLGRTSLEGSRRFDALKLWMSFKILGHEGYALLVERAHALTMAFANLIVSHPYFQLTSAVETNILTYRFVPAPWKNMLELLRAKLFSAHRALSLQEHEILCEFNRNIAEFLNDINIEIQKRQRTLGKNFVSRTTLESVQYDVDVVVLRAVLFNPHTTEDILREILEEQKNLGMQILHELWNKQKNQWLEKKNLPILQDFWIPPL